MAEETHRIEQAELKLKELDGKLQTLTRVIKPDSDILGLLSELKDVRGVLVEAHGQDTAQKQKISEDSKKNKELQEENEKLNYRISFLLNYINRLEAENRACSAQK